MSLINDALKRAEDEKNNRTPVAPLLSSMEVETAGTDRAQAGIEYSTAPRRHGNNKLILLAVIGVVALGAAWFMLKNKATPASARANIVSTPTRLAKTAPAASRPAKAMPAQAAPSVLAKTPAVKANAPGNSATASKTAPDKTPATRPAGEPPTLTADPSDGGVMTILTNFLWPTPPELLDGLPHATPGLTTSAKSQPPRSTGPKPAASPTTAKPAAKPVVAAKSVPAPKPAAKPDKGVAATAGINQQFHVSCILFSDQGSTAVVNGSPVKVGQTVRAEGPTKTENIDEAVIKKIDRNCVEIEINGDRYTLRI